MVCPSRSCPARMCLSLGFAVTGSRTSSQLTGKISFPCGRVVEFSDFMPGAALAQVLQTGWVFLLQKRPMSCSSGLGCLHTSTSSSLRLSSTRSSAQVPELKCIHFRCLMFITNTSEFICFEPFQGLSERSIRADAEIKLLPSNGEFVRLGQ